MKMLTWGRLELNYDRTGLSIPARYNVMRNYTCDTKEMPAPVLAPPRLHSRELNTLGCFINHSGTVNGLPYTSLWLPSLDSLLSNAHFLPEFGAIFQECGGEGNSAFSQVECVHSNYCSQRLHRFSRHSTLRPY